MKNNYDFSRRNFTADSFSQIGNSYLGGKAEGLKLLNIFTENKIFDNYPNFEVSIPKTIVVSTIYFDKFMVENNLYSFALKETDDNRIAHRFLKSSLPAEILGDLRAIAQKKINPLAIRSSSLLEDSTETPMAGIYATKMIPCNQPSSDIRFDKIVEAIKLIYASTFFSNSKTSLNATNNDILKEKMAVIIQDVVGKEKNKHFYPDISGVARTFNYYPTGNSESKHGVISLALGLGKFIVDGGNPWPYSPAYPSSPPPYKSIKEMLKNTQTFCWVINMDVIKEYNPVSESEYLIRLNLKEAEYDNSLKYAVSTYDPYSDRLDPGIACKGPRVITFAPILQNKELPLNSLLSDLMAVCKNELHTHVEIEFAVTTSPGLHKKHKLALLQVRPLNISEESVSIDFNTIDNNNIIIKSHNSMGNGNIKGIKDIVYISPDDFSFNASRNIAKEIEIINRQLLEDKRKYVLIGFGRWGSSDSWLGIPVSWGMISGAGVIVEASLKDRPVDFSQGSHFFHNIANLRIPYICIDNFSNDFLNWEWLNSLSDNKNSKIVKTIRLENPLTVMVDGRVRTGVVLHE
jgi:hypothetical protein